MAAEDSRSLGMTSQREMVALALRDVIHEKAFSECGMGVDTCPDWPLAYELADAALDTLGLTDWEAAVMRGARRLVWEQYQGCVQWDDDPTDTATSGDEGTRQSSLHCARAVLEAALSATEGPHDE